MTLIETSQPGDAAFGPAGTAVARLGASLELEIDFAEPGRVISLEAAGLAVVDAAELRLDDQIALRALRAARQPSRASPIVSAELGSLAVLATTIDTISDRSLRALAQLEWAGRAAMAEPALGFAVRARAACRSALADLEDHPDAIERWGDRQLGEILLRAAGVAPATEERATLIELAAQAERRGGARPSRRAAEKLSAGEPPRLTDSAAVKLSPSVLPAIERREAVGELLLVDGDDHSVTVWLRDHRVPRGLWLRLQPEVDEVLPIFAPFEQDATGVPTASLAWPPGVSGRGSVEVTDSPWTPTGDAPARASPPGHRSRPTSCPRPTPRTRRAGPRLLVVLCRAVAGGRRPRPLRRGSLVRRGDRVGWASVPFQDPMDGFGVVSSHARALGSASVHRGHGGRGRAGSGEARPREGGDDDHRRSQLPPTASGAYVHQSGPAVPKRHRPRPLQPLVVPSGLGTPASESGDPRRRASTERALGRSAARWLRRRAGRR